MPSNLSEIDKAILSGIVDEPMTVDELCAATELSAGQVSAALTMLQLKGLIRRIAGARFLRVKR
jgi:predicted Rossmann fold nucleotide-binding protein DprA/Smf involved in DNA uptake